jgi:hypothetical protein
VVGDGDAEAEVKTVAAFHRWLRTLSYQVRVYRCEQWLRVNLVLRAAGPHLLI